MAAELPDRTLTLDDSVRLAINNSQGLLTAHEDVDIALQRVRESESLFFPKLDLNANWSKFRVEGSNPLLLQPALGPTLVDNSPRQNFYTARANIYQTVYEGGRARNTWRQARISFERARNINETLQLQVEASAKQAFYDLLLAEEKKRQYDTLSERVRSAAEASGLSIGEQLRLEEELSKVRSGEADAILGVREAQLAYLHTLNLELNTNVQLKGALITHPVELDLQKMLAWSSQYRSELRQTEYQQELDALGISLSLAERTPTVAFGASYERTGHDVDQLQTANWAGTLNVNLPVSISDMFYGWAKVRERRAQYRQATLKHAETEDQIQLQVREAYTKYRFWQDELPTREKDFRRLEKMVESLREGRKSTVERVMAERLLTESRLRYQEAIHGHLSALAAIEKAVGHPISGDL
jgi:outer membrane protein